MGPGGANNNSRAAAADSFSFVNDAMKAQK